jgi:hypothetical protein
METPTTATGNGPYRAPHPRKSTEKRLVSLREVMAAIAYESVRISPYPIPVNLEIVLRKAHMLLKDQGFEPPFPTDLSFLLCEMTYEQVLGMLDQHLKAIPEFRRWNITKGEQDQGYTDPEDPNRPVQFVAVGRGMVAPDPDNDFVDLDAHIGNTALLIWNQSNPEETEATMALVNEVHGALEGA